MRKQTVAQFRISPALPLFMARESFALSISTTDHFAASMLVQKARREKRGITLHTLLPLREKNKAVYPPYNGLTVKKNFLLLPLLKPPGGIITEAMKRENTNRKHRREGKKVEEKISRNGFFPFFPHCTCNSSCTVAEKMVREGNCNYVHKRVIQFSANSLDSSCSCS